MIERRGEEEWTYSKVECDLSLLLLYIGEEACFLVGL
jgi:hypothetical protein